MRRQACIILGVFLLSCLLSAVCAAADERWEFDGVGKVRLDGVSGDIELKPASSTSLVVELTADVQPSDSFQAKVEQENGTISIKEKWRGNSSGKVSWVIHVPVQKKSVQFRMDNASGDLTAQGIAAKISFDTASGDVELSDVSLGEDSDFNTASGDFTLTDMTVTEDCEFNTASGDLQLENLTIEDGCEFSTASGDIDCSNCKGYFELSSASGDIEIRDCQVSGSGEFSSASGDVDIHFGQLTDTDLTASSASGDVTLSVDEFGDDFTLVLTKREDKGRITCPFAYTSERTYEDHHTYEEKTVKKGTGTPEIALKTASGKVSVRE